MNSAYNLRFANQPRKFLDKLKEKNQKEELYNRIKKLSENPLLGKKLHPPFRNGERSYRDWPLRIIYIFDTHKKELLILKIEHRSSVYK